MTLKFFIFSQVRFVKSYHQYLDVVIFTSSPRPAVCFPTQQVALPAIEFLIVAPARPLPEEQ